MENARKQSIMARQRGMSVMTTNSMFGPAMGPNEMPPRMPAPPHRHAAPSGPWPFLDVDDFVDQDQLNQPPTQKDPAENCTHIDPVKCDNCWKGYPQSLYPNWTQSQQRKSLIANIIIKRSIDSCTIHYSDVRNNGTFDAPRTLPITSQRNEAHWNFMIKRRPDTTQLRAMFLDELSGPVLQMIGTKYNVEPFFWSSSLRWIPSRYQESVVSGDGDHITITLRFIRSIDNPTTTAPPSPITPDGPRFAEPFSEGDPSEESSMDDYDEQPYQPHQIIDTQAPLELHSESNDKVLDKILMPDLMALHLVRVRSPRRTPSSEDEAPSPTSPYSPSSPFSGGSSTLISYHPTTKHRTTPALTLHARFALIGRSVYWEHIFEEFPDPTFVLLALMWYPLYSWDEAFEVLYNHVGYLEMNVIGGNPLYITHELHIVHAHILHYAALLEDFRKSIVFIMDTPNPALDHPDYDDIRVRSQERLKKECESLLREIKRLEDTRAMMGRRLKNVMNLGFSQVNISDSRYMAKLSEATLADSAAMKQIAYLTMIFLPSSFVATVFGMNVKEINPGTFQTLGHYITATILLTVLTVWTIIAFQYPLKGTSALKHSSSEPPTSSSSTPRPMWKTVLKRALWPITMFSDLSKSRKKSSGRSKGSERQQHDYPYSAGNSTTSKSGSKLGGWWTAPRLPRWGRPKEAHVDPGPGLVQSPLPLSPFRQEGV